MFQSMYQIAVLGAGNGGTAYAGYLSSMGHSVRLWNRRCTKMQDMMVQRIITLSGALETRAHIEVITESLVEAVHDAQIIFITTTANAHRELAIMLAPLLEEGQIVALSPGKTAGALEFRNTIYRMGCRARVHVTELQSLVFACRLIRPSHVQVFGIKECVPIATFPAKDIKYVLPHLKYLFPCFEAAPNVLFTSLGNIGAIFHPAIALFNFTAIEREEEFYPYQDITDSVANFLTALDLERLALGRAFGIDLVSIFDWIKKAYPCCTGDTLSERMRTNPAYHKIRGSVGLSSRFLLEDISTGLVPLAGLGQVVGLEMPLTWSIIHIMSTTLGIDFWGEGRNLEKLDLTGITASDIVAYISK